MSLTKISNGVIFSDELNEENLLWSITPNDSSRYEYTSDGVLLKHGDGRLIMSLPSPYDYKEYFLEASFEHEPRVLSDIAGIVFLATTDDAIECQSYYPNSGTNEYYKHVRVGCSSELYTFFISKDGITWEEAGNSRLPNSNRIGFFIDGVVEQNSRDLLAKRLVIYKSRFALIKGTNFSNIVKVYDKDGNYIPSVRASQSKEGLTLDLSMVQQPFDATIEFIDANGVVVNTIDNIEVSSGDTYELIDNIKFYINSVLAEAIDSILHIGTLTGKVNYISLRVFNNSDTVTLTNKTISVDKFSPYTHGHEKVKLAYEIDGVEYEKLEYTDSLLFESITPKDSARIIMRIERAEKDFVPSIDNSFKFRVNVE